MFYTWMADGKLPPNMRLQLIGPGMPGQPMYYVIPAKAANMIARLNARVPMELYTNNILINDSAKTTAQMTLSPFRFSSAQVFIPSGIVAGLASFPILFP
jgi:hypothetical protein